MTESEALAVLADATSAIVCDALDRMGLREQALDPALRPLWPAARLVGPAMPVVVVCEEAIPDQPYAGEMAALDALAPGEVPVFQIESGSRAAAWGELFSCGAIGRGAVGAVCDGFVRDARERRYYWQICGLDSCYRNCDHLRAPCYLRYHWGRYKGERPNDDVHIQSGY